VDSIIVNVVYLALFAPGEAALSAAFSRENLVRIASSRVALVVLNGALMGITTSLFLKHLNSVLKVGEAETTPPLWPLRSILFCARA
jgi:hypothetical protein